MIRYTYSLWGVYRSTPSRKNFLSGFGCDLFSSLINISALPGEDERSGVREVIQQKVDDVPGIIVRPIISSPSQQEGTLISGRTTAYLQNELRFFLFNKAESL